MTEIESIVKYAIDNHCSDVHLTEGGSPYFRRHGTIGVSGSFQPSTKDTIFALIGQEERAKLASGSDVDIATSLCGGRQRVNIFRESRRLACAIRLLSDSIPTLEQLGMPPVLTELAEKPNGLVLVTGPTGSGKSTTLAAMINYIAQNRRRHIITIEDPIEYQYTSSLSLIHQREIGRDVQSFSAAIRSALREDPDVMLVGEMRDYETISAAITAAETGHLVFSTLHTTGATRTVERIIDVFPSEAQAQVRTQLSGVLRGVITQKLLPLADGSGRIAAQEIMIGTDAILSLIREGKTHQILSSMQSGAASGMKTLEKHLAELVRAGKITQETALENASLREEFGRMMRF